MDDLIAEFIAETRDMLDALGGEIVAWEAAPDDRARLDAIFRFVHTVKGNCGFFDLPRLEALSHAAENVLADVRGGSREPDGKLVSAVLGILDRIGELVHALETGEAVSSADDEQLIEALSERAIAADQAHDGAIVAPSDPRRSVRSIRLSVDLLDRMMSGVSDTVLARNELARCLRENPGDVSVEAAFQRVSTCIAELRDAITRTRMQRIETLFLNLPRMVRDLAGELGKQVRLEIDGGDVELDREMIEMIRDPLTHIVRNAVDHGIESPADRDAAGKPAAGKLRICARQSGNQIMIEIADDGRGLDGNKLASKAVASGLISSEEAKKLSPAQKNALIFEAGLSTAAEVTAISGRGVGMDVVRANIERIGGVVDVDSKAGQGIRLTLRVPLTLTIIPALTVSVGSQTYAIPRSAIEEIVRSSGNGVRLESLAGACVATIRERRMPMIALSDVLLVGTDAEAENRRMIVLKPAGGDRYALAVDKVHDHEELVVKPAAPAVMATGLYAGTTLADDGRPILLLDPSGIAACAGLALDQNEIEKLSAKAEEAEAPREEVRVLVFKSLDGVRRAIRIAVLERIEDVRSDAISFSAGRLRLTVDGRILPLAGCNGRKPEGLLRVLRLSDGSAELAYGFAEVVDIVTLDSGTYPAEAPGEVGGVTLVGGDQVELLDPYWLFASHAAAGSSEVEPPVCAFATDDPWMQNILRPMVEAAGYRVVGASAADDEGADLIIATAESSGGAAALAGRLLKIRSSPEPQGENDDSVYRYDKEGLLNALGRHAATRNKA